MGLNLGTLLVQIGVDTGSMERGFLALQQTVSKLGGTMAASGAQMANAFAAPTAEMQGLIKQSGGFYLVDQAMQKTAQSATNVGTAVQTMGKHMHGGGAEAQGFAGRLGELYTKMNLLFGGMALTATITAPFIGFMVSAAKESISFESAFTGVRKTVDASEADFKKLENNFRQMSLVMPITADQLAKIGELAGQMGIRGVENITKFTDTIARLSVTTNMTVEDASMQMARFANIMQVPIKDVDKLGNTVVVLGNNMATTEAEIMTFAMRLAGAGKVVGLSSDQVFAFGAALSSAGIHAEEGGSAMSRVFMKIAQAVKGGGKELDQFAKVAKMSAGDFKTEFETNAGNAIKLFIEGLARMQKSGVDVFKVLQDLEAGDIRVMRSLLNTANAGDLLDKSLRLAGGAITNTNALLEESEKRFGTVQSRIMMVQNNFAELRREIGDKLKSVLVGLLEMVDKLITWFRELSPTVQNMILAIGGVLAIIGPLMIALSGIGAVLLGLKALFVLFGGSATASMGVILSTVGLVVLAIMAVAAAAVYIITNWEDVKATLIRIWGVLKIIWDLTMAALTKAFSEMIYKLNSAAAKFWGWFNDELGKRMQDAADKEKAYADEYVASRERMAQAEYDLIMARDKQRQMMKDIKTIKSWSDDEAESLKGVEGWTKAAVSGINEEWSSSNETKKKYLDEFEKAFGRSQDDMLDDFTRKQEEQTTRYKEFISRDLVAMKAKHEEEITAKKYALERLLEAERTVNDKMKINDDAILDAKLDDYKIALREEEVAYKRSQEKRLDDLKDAQEKELDEIQNKFDKLRAMNDAQFKKKLAERQAKIDDMEGRKKGEDEREKLAQMRERINESARETNKLAASVNFGAYEEAVKKADEVLKQAGGEATPELVKAERDVLEMREGLNDKAFEAYKKHKEAILKADAKEKAATKAALDSALRSVYDAMEKSAKNTKQLEKDLADELQEGANNAIKDRLRDEMDALRESAKNKEDALDDEEKAEASAAKKRQDADAERMRKEIEDSIRLNKDILDELMDRQKIEIKLENEDLEEKRNLRMLAFQKTQKDDLEQYEWVRKTQEEEEQKHIKKLEDDFKNEQAKTKEKYKRDIQDLHDKFEGNLGEQQSFLDDWNKMVDELKSMEPTIAPISGYEEAIGQAQAAVSVFQGLADAVAKMGSSVSDYKPPAGPSFSVPSPGPAPTPPGGAPSPVPSAPFDSFPPGFINPNIPYTPFPWLPPGLPGLTDFVSNTAGKTGAVINVNGAGDPEAVASKVVRIMRREGLTFA